MVSVSAVWVAVVSSSVSVTGISVSVSVSWVSVSISAIVSFWFSISFGFTLVQLVDSISGSWGAYVLVGSSSGKSVLCISVWGIGTIEYSWVGISGSLATVVSISVSVIWVSITVSMAIVSTISVASISKTVSV